tara:strand:+ start:3104 stop:4381 length:1278 start_codon:yes stop_codon:yes gene_type:complete
MTTFGNLTAFKELTDKDFKIIRIDDLQDIFVLKNLIRCDKETEEKFLDSIKKTKLPKLYKHYSKDSKEYNKQLKEREKLLAIPDYEFNHIGRVIITLKEGYKDAELEMYEFKTVEVIHEEDFDYDYDYNYDWNEEAKRYEKITVNTLLANITYGYLEDIITNFSDIFTMTLDGFKIVNRLYTNWEDNLMTRFYKRWTKGSHKYFKLLNKEIFEGLKEGLSISFNNNSGFWRVGNKKYYQEDLDKLLEGDYIKTIYYNYGCAIEEFPKNNWYSDSQYTHSHLEYYNEHVKDNLANDIIYTAAFPNTNIFEKYECIHPKQYGHHMTVSYRPEELDVDMGRKTVLKVVGRLTTDKIDALILENSVSKNFHPHITLSTRYGIEPSEVNYFIDIHKDKIESLDDTIKATYGFYGYENGVKGVFKKSKKLN